MADHDGKSLCEFTHNKHSEEQGGKNCLSDPNMEISTLHEESFYNEMDFLEEYINEHKSRDHTEEKDEYSDVLKMYSRPEIIVVKDADADFANLNIQHQSTSEINEVPSEYEAHYVDNIHDDYTNSDKVKTRTFILGKPKHKKGELLTIESNSSFENLDKAESFFKNSAAIFSYSKFDDFRSKNAVKCRIKKYKFNNRETEIISGGYSEKDLRSVTEESRSSEKKRNEESELVEELEKRAMQSPSTNSFKNREEEIKRFYLANSSSVANIESCFKINDLRSSTLLGKMTMREGEGSWKLHWFQFKGNNLSCYNKKKIPLTVLHGPNEAAGDIVHPEDNNYFLTRKFVVNIFESRVYLVKNKVSFLDCIKCPLFFKQIFPEMLDITESVVTMIIKVGNNYKVTIKDNNGNETFVLVPILEFALENNGSYIFLRLDEIEIFLRWIVSILFRQGRLDIKYG